MNRLPAALALFALLSPSTTMAEPCAPRVELAGDREAVARVAVELKTLGVMLGPIEPAERSCSVNAMVTLEGEGIAVAVQNSSARSEGRVVSDPKIAAAWIDSWVRDEIEVASWAIAELPPAAPSTLNAMPMVSTSGAASVAAPEVAPSTSPLERVGFSAAVERSWTEDETTWNGFDIAGCTRVGPWCIGGRIRAGFQNDQSFNYNAVADRSDIVALATIAMPFTLGQVSIAPEVGLGAGRMHTKRVEACTAPPPSMVEPGCSDPTDPMCMNMPPPDPNTGTTGCVDASGNPTMNVYVGDNYDKATYLPRLGFAVRFAFPIVRHVWLDAVAAYTLTPIMRRTDFLTQQELMDPSIVMPSEPWKSYQLGLGIRVGIP